MRNCLFVCLVTNKMKWIGKTVKRPFLKVCVEEPLSLGNVAVGYEWKWPWNADSHCMSQSWLHFLENDDLLIYSPSPFRALSFPHAPIIITDIISFFHFTLFFFLFSLLFKVFFYLLASDFCPTSCCHSFPLMLFITFLLWPFYYQWQPNSAWEQSAHSVWPQLFELWVIWNLFYFQRNVCKLHFVANRPLERALYMKIVSFITKFKSKWLQR